MERKTAMMNFMALAPGMKQYQKVTAELPVPKIINTEKERNAWKKVLKELMAEPEEKMSAGRVDYVKTVAQLIEAYDREQYKAHKVSPIEVLRELMEEHGLIQDDLIDVFGSGAARLLRGQREKKIEHETDSKAAR